MPLYAYKARDNLDKLYSGTIEGTTIDEVLEQLGERKLMPVALNPVDSGNVTGKSTSMIDSINETLIRLQNRVSYKSVVFFTRQLATMVEGGVPLVRAIEQIAKSEKPIFKRILDQVANDIAMGSSFSDAITAHPGAFNTMYVAVVRSGEVAGALDEVLNELATHLENVEAMKGKVKSALRYPKFIGGFVFGLIVVILWTLVPMFGKLYASMGRELPAATQLLIDISNLIQQKFLLVTGAGIVAFAGYKFAMSNTGFERFVHRARLLFPVFGSIARKHILALFSRTLALLIENGTPILNAIEISGAVVQNRYYSEHIQSVHEDLRQGELLSVSLEKTGAFPVLITQLVATGEQSGKVSMLLRKAADFYEREIKNVVDSLAAIIEPFLIITLGAVVGGMLLALYLPIFSLNKAIN